MASATLAARSPAGLGAHAPLGTFLPGTPQRGPWTYVDEARTHEVHAQVLALGPSHRFVAREWSFGERGRAEPFETSATFQEPWEVKFHVAELEGRLATLGRYWRHEASRPGWSPVGPNPALPRVDLRGLDLGTSAPGATFHSFHGRQGRDHLLVALPAARASSFALADLAFDPSRMEAGELRMLHPGLPGPLLRSALAREHLCLVQKGYDKLASPAEFALVYGPSWRERVAEAFGRVVEKLSAGPLAPAAPEPAPAQAEAAAPPVDYARVLTDPRLLALHARFLRPGEEASLMAGGEPAIRRAIASKRRAAAHSDQHRLSALEAGLLARHALGARTSVDPEAARILRRLDLLL